MLSGVTGDFCLYNNDMLDSVLGLAGLNTVGGYLNIQSCGALSSLDGLSNLDSVGGYFQIWDNDALTTMLGDGSAERRLGERGRQHHRLPQRCARPVPARVLPRRAGSRPGIRSSARGWLARATA
jgi:hypothetical protein